MKYVDCTRLVMRMKLLMIVMVTLSVDGENWAAAAGVNRESDAEIRMLEWLVGWTKP